MYLYRTKLIAEKLFSEDFDYQDVFSGFGDWDKKTDTCDIIQMECLIYIASLKTH